ncbi:MAG: 30S ribosomal protein S6 [Patescibacteria group bacterium]
MNKYEFTVVLAGKVTPAKKKSIIGKLEKLLKGVNGEVGKLSDWGEIEFAYPVKKNNSGIFLHFPLELEPESASNLDSKLNLEEDVIRYLLVRKE